MVSCRACGVLHPRELLSPPDMQALLERLMTQSDPLDARPRMACEGSEIEVEMLRRHVPGLLAGGRALDVGCAMGDFVACLRSLGMQATGLEPFAQRARIGVQHGIDVRVGRFDTETLAALDFEPFDLISFRESLYYLDDYRIGFDLIRRHLKPGGMLYLKVHSPRSPFYWRYNNNLRLRVGLTATAFFDPSVLERILREQGFRVVAKTPLPLSFRHAIEAWGLPSLLNRFAAIGERVMPALPPDRLLYLAARD